jgi:hypothetical protein
MQADIDSSTPQPIAHGAVVDAVPAHRCTPLHEVPKQCDLRCRLLAHEVPDLTGHEPSERLLSGVRHENQQLDVQDGC